MKSTLVEKIIKTNAHKMQDILSNSGKIYTFLNPVSYIIALDNKALFEQFDGIFADGSALVSAIRVLYRTDVKRMSFDMTSIAPVFLSYAEKFSKTIYIVASMQEQVVNAVEIFRKQYPLIKIVGYRNGYFFSDKEQYDEAMHIVDVNPDFLIVGMGTLIQEKFLLKVKSLGYKGIGFTCGGFIHQISKNRMYYYPDLVNRINFRFVYRMYKEPHTRKRYLQATLIFPIRFIWEKFYG